MSNAVVQEFRKDYPESPLSDEEITIRLYDETRDNPIFDSDPDFRREALEIKRLTLTPGDYAAQAIGAAGRGATQGFAAIPKAAAVLASGLPIPSVKWGEDSSTGGLEFTLSNREDPRKSYPYKLGEAVERAGEAVTPEPREGLEDSFWATQLPGTIGGLAPMVAGGATGAALRAGSRAAATVGATSAGMMQQGVAGYEDAKRHGASDSDAFKSFLLNAGVTASEIVPVASVLSRLDRLSGGTFKKALINAGKDSLSEALQEAFQGYAGNKIANTIVAYDPAREDFDGLIEQAGAGGVVGALMSLALSGIGGHVARNRERGPAQLKDEPKAKEVIQESAAIAPYTQGLTDDRKQYLFAFKQRELQGTKTDEDFNAERTFEDNEKAYLVDGTVEANAREDLKQQAKREGEKYAERQNEEAGDEERIEAGIREQAGAIADQGSVPEVTPPAPGMAPEDAALLEQIIAEKRAELEGKRDLENDTALLDQVVGEQRRRLEGERALEQARAQQQPDIVAQARARAAAMEEPVTATPGRFRPAPQVPTPSWIPNVVTTPPTRPAPVPVPPTPLPSPAPVPAPAAEHPLIASIDFAGGYTVEIGHPVELNMGEPGRMGNRGRISDRLILGGRGAEDNPKNTKRVTFFKDTDKDSKTFGQVVALNTYRRADGTVQVENPKGGKIGMDIIKLPSKFEPVMSLRMNKAEKRAPVWLSAEEFEAVREQAMTRYSAERAGTEAFIEGTQTGFTDAEGNFIETAPADASTSPERESRDKLADLIIDKLPKTKDGKSIAKNLTKADMEEAVLDAFASVENADDADARDFALKQALEVAAKDSRFKSASNLEKQQMLVRVVTHEIFTAYQKGNFATQTPGINLFIGQTVTGERGAIEESGGAQSGVAGLPGEPDESTRLSTGRAASQYRVRNDSITKRFWDTLAALGAAGSDVRTIQSAFDSQGGIYRSSGIVLAMHDLNSPSLGNLVDLLHEAIHGTFAGLSVEQQARLHQAVESLRLSPGFSSQISSAVPASQRAAVVFEERIVEHTAQQLVAQGFNATESRGIAQALWRAIKDAYFRAAMWIQEGMFGKGNASPELATAWFENRVKAALSGDPRPMSFISFLGGPKLRPNQVVEAMVPATGLGHVTHYDPDIGAWITPDLLPDSMEAVDATIRYRWTNTTADEKPVMEDSAAVGDQRRNVAGLNVVDNALRESWDHFNSRGLNRLPGGGQIYPTYEDWLRQFIASNELRSLPSERIAKINQALQSKGLPPIATDLRYDQMTSEDGRLQGATFGYGLLRPVRIGLEKARNEAESVLNGIQTKIDRANNKLQKLWQNYTSKDLIASNTKAELTQSIRNANSDFRQALQLTRKESTLSQVLRQLDKKVMDPLYLSRQYEGIINRMYREFTGDTAALNSFVDVLEAIATYPLPAGVDWRNSTVTDLRDALLQDTNPITERLRDRDANGDLTPEAVSLMGMAISFAKHDYSTMLFLQLSKLNTEQGRLAVNNALQASLGAAKDSINRARTLVDSKRYPRAFAIAQRLLDEYQKTFDLHASLQAERERLTLFKDTHDIIIVPVMEKHFGEMDRVLGATTVAWYPEQGASYGQPPTATATMVETLANKKEIKLARDGRLAQEIRDDLKSKQTWLDSIPVDKRDKNWQDLQDQVIKMANIEIDYEHNTLTQGRISRMSGIITNQLDGTGVPALQEVARMLRNYTAWMDADKHPVRAASIEWSALEYKLIKSLKKYDRHKLSQAQERHSILDPAKKFITDNAALYEEIADVDRADAEMFRRLRVKADEIMPSGVMTEQSWKALAALIKKDREIGQMLMAISIKRGNKIEDPVLGIHRKPVGQRLGIFPQMLNGYSTLMYDSMRATWGKQVVGNKWVLNQWVPDKEALGKVADGYSAKYTQDPNALRAELAPFYTADVWNGFVKDIVERDTGAFDAPAALDGLKLGAGRHNTMRAWRESGGDVVTFAERLGALEGVAPAKKSAFVGETISTFNAFWSSLQNQKVEQADSQGVSLANLSHFLLDSRKAEEFPAPWMQYQTYTQPEAQSKLTKILEHAAYGRDAKAALTNFQKAITELEELAVRYSALSNSIPKGPNYRAEQKRVFAPLGGLKLYEDAAKNLQIARDSKSHFDSLLASQSTVMTDFGAWAEFFHFAPYAAVQGIGTVLTDTIAPTKWIQKYGFSTVALQAMTGNYAKFGYNLWGGIMNSFSRQYTLVSENVQRYNRMGYVQSEQQIKLGDKLRAITNAAQVPVSGKLTDHLGRYVKIGVRGLKATLSQPLPKFLRAGLKDPQFSPVTPLAPFAYESLLAHASSTQQSWSVFENLVLRAVEFFNQPQNAHLIDDTTFRLDAGHLGYKKYFFGVVDDVSAFKHMVSDLAKRGMTLERLAKEAIDRRSLNLPNTPLLSDKAYQLIGQIGPSEITMDGNVTNRPWFFLNSPSGSFFSPLLGWSWAQADSVPRAFREPNGEATLKAFQRGMTAFAAIAPIAIAYAVMRQWYDEYGLGKKQNVLDFAQVKNPVDALKVTMDMIARVGTLGLGGEAINSVLNSQTNRDFTLDNRIFFMSSLLSVKRAMETWARQGAEGTWQTVYRPLFQGVGGSGYLQYADLLNNALSLDNQESRVVARINVGNYLRTAGRGLGWDVRTSKAQSTLASASHAWIAEMLLSALADDPVTFREARMKAVAASKEEGYPDAEDHVKRSFTSMNPLKTPFQTTKSAAEYRKLINSMNENGQEAVRGAVRNYNRYAERIGIKPFEGKQPKQEAHGFGSFNRSFGGDFSAARMRATLGLQRDSMFSTANY